MDKPKQKKDLLKSEPGFKYKPRFAVVIEVENEAAQRKAYEKLLKGYPGKVKLLRV